LKGSVQIVHANFLEVEISGPFHVVAYWSGFGTGSEAEHITLLRRVAGWLGRDGRAVVEVFEPDWWSRCYKREEFPNGIMRTLGFDANTKRLQVTYV
jgi:hypothetical protein